MYTRSKYHYLPSSLVSFVRRKKRGMRVYPALPVIPGNRSFAFLNSENNMYVMQSLSFSYSIKVEDQPIVENLNFVLPETSGVPPHDGLRFPC